MATDHLERKILAMLKGGEVHGTYRDLRYKCGLKCGTGSFKKAIKELVERGRISSKPREGFSHQVTLALRNR